MNLILKAAAVASVVLLGLMSGFFYAYSVDVMIALDRLAPETAIEAMNSINFVVRNPVFFVTFFLTPVFCVGTGAALWRSQNGSSGLWIGGAGLFYAAFALVPTMLINVPMNEALAALTPAQIGENAEALWLDYSPTWTFWNSARTVTSAFAAALAAIGLIKL